MALVPFIQVRKCFDGEWFDGVVKEWFADIGCWHVEYEDGDEEDYSPEELAPLIVLIDMLLNLMCDYVAVSNMLHRRRWGGFGAGGTQLH